MSVSTIDDQLHDIEYLDGSDEISACLHVISMSLKSHSGQTSAQPKARCMVQVCNRFKEKFDVEVINLEL